MLADFWRILSLPSNSSCAQFKHMSQTSRRMSAKARPRPTGHGGRETLSPMSHTGRQDALGAGPERIANILAAMLGAE